MRLARIQAELSNDLADVKQLKVAGARQLYSSEPRTSGLLPSISRKGALFYCIDNQYQDILRR